MEAKKITRSNIGEHLLDYQLEMIGKTRVDIIDAYNWRSDFTMTSMQFVEFRDYSIHLLQRVFKFNRMKAISTFEFFWTMFGVRVKN